MQTTIQIRVDKKLKEKASKTLETFGIDLSAGVKLFLNNVVSKQSLDFTPMNEKGEKLRYFEEYKKEGAWLIKHGKRYTDVKELIKDALTENGVPYNAHK
jgi:addiction module RelB/DinJ family antitoxin